MGGNEMSVRMKLPSRSWVISRARMPIFDLRILDKAGGEPGGEN
jgi:hypothetical protein